MVASTITVVPKYLNCKERFALAGGVSTLEDDTVVHESDSKTTSTTERSDRVRRSWQLSWSDASHASGDTDAQFIYNLFEVCRNSKAFLFVSPLAFESEAEDQPLRNTVTGLGTGNGSATTFQLQRVVSLSYDVGVGSASSTAWDINYPLQGSVVAYADGSPVTISSVNLLTGVVTLSSAPSNGAVMTADFEYAYAVIFSSQSVSASLIEAMNKEVRSVQLREII